MINSIKRQTNLFIVRLWTEYLLRDPPAFRGEVEHVISKQKYYFINMEELNQFLLNCSVEYKLQSPHESKAKEKAEE